jgi:nitrite reductase/ring-hydroxylating ferredoxin subunit
MADEHFERRMERIVRDLLAGRRLKVGPNDSAEREAIMAAARLAALRDPHPRMAPGFRKNLKNRLREERWEPPRIFSRREALLAGLAAATGAAGAGAIARFSGLLGAETGHSSRGAKAPAAGSVSSVDPGEIMPITGTWFDAGPLAALPDGQAVHFRAGAVPAVLFREGERVRGLSAVCTHLPCELIWNGGEKTLDCPCHNRSFDVQGKFAGDGYQQALPALPRVSVRIVGGRVQVLGA